MKSTASHTDKRNEKEKKNKSNSLIAFAPGKKSFLQLLFTTFVTSHNCFFFWTSNSNKTFSKFEKEKFEVLFLHMHQLFIAYGINWICK